MKKLVFTLACILTLTASFAQQEPMFTHYAFNTQAVNPAYAGNRGMMTMTLLHRSQWVGFEGAPMSQTFTMNTPIYRNALAVGVSLRNDKIGPTNIFGGDIDLAYKLKLNKKNHLAFGLKGTVSYFDRNLTGLYAHESGDMAIDNSSRNDILFDVGFGLLYTHEHFYIGLSTPKVILNNFEDALNSTDPLGAKEIQNFYFTAGGIVDLGANTQWRPSTFVRATYGAPITVDVTSMFVFNEKFEIGPMWRSYDAIGMLVGYTFNNNLRIGYSFDASYGNRTLGIGSAETHISTNFGSHELMLRYDLFYKGNKDIYSPRYF